MNTREDLLAYVKENWNKIPYLCSMPEEGIKEFIEKGITYNTGNPLEHVTISKINNSDGEREVIKSSVLGYDEEAQSDDYFLTSQMGFNERGEFSGSLYGNEAANFSIGGDGEVHFHTLPKEKEVLLEKIKEDKTIVTHFGDDLDNKSSIYALEKFLKKMGVLQQGENLNVERVPAGQVKEGRINIDTGGHTGNKIDEDKNTIVIDGDPKNGVKSACQSLSKIGIYVPEQICELADTRPARVSALDSRSGLALVRYLSGEQAFKLAENELLDKTLTDEQLEKYGLTQAHEKQQKVIDAAVEKINKYTAELPNGEKVVLSPEQIVAGSGVAYEMGIPYYASTNQHLDKDGNPDGVTFAISCKPGMKLPAEILEYGKQLVEQYRIDEKTSGVFVNPNGELIVAGGPKNPNFKIEGHTPETMLEELKTVMSSDRDNKFVENIVSAAKKKVELKDKKVQAVELAKAYEKQLPEHDKSFDD